MDSKGGLIQNQKLEFLFMVFGDAGTQLIPKPQTLGSDSCICAPFTCYQILFLIYT